MTSCTSSADLNDVAIIQYSGKSMIQGNNDSHNGLCMVTHGIFFVLVRLVDLFDQSRVVH